MFIDPGLMKLWGLSVYPSLTDVDLNSPDSEAINLIDKQELDDLVHSVLQAHNMRPGSILCVTGERGSGKTTLLKMLSEELNNSNFIDVNHFVDLNTPKSLTDKNYFNFCKNIIETCDESRQSTLLNFYHNLVDDLSSRNLSGIEKVIQFNEHFSKLDLSNHTVIREPFKKFVILDNIDKFEKYDYRFFLQIVGVLASVYENICFIVPVDYSTRDLFVYQSFRGVATDITDVYKTHHLRSSEIIQRRIDLVQSIDSNFNVFSDNAYQLFDQTKNHRFNLHIASSSISKAHEFIDRTSPTIIDRDILRLIDTQDLNHWSNYKYYSFIDSSPTSYTFSPDISDDESGVSADARSAAINASVQIDFNDVFEQVLGSEIGQMLGKETVFRAIKAMRESAEVTSYCERYEIHRVSSMMMQIKDFKSKINA